jgi:hypothetical protein
MDAGNQLERLAMPQGEIGREGGSQSLCLRFRDVGSGRQAHILIGHGISFA